MQILQIPPERIHPDPNQPRKSFDQDRINELAQSIISEGIINPIEIDENNIIITGETRWRAARVAKLKTVPCKRLTALDPEKRFQRQVIENIQQHSLSGWDTALALAKMLKLPSENIQINQGMDIGIRTLARTIGKGVHYIQEHLLLLTASEPIQEATKTHVRKGGLPVSITRALTKTPQQFKQAMEKKILAREFTSRDAAVAVTKSLRDFPQKSKELLAYDYSKCTNLTQIGQALGKILGPELHFSPGDELGDKSQKMKDLTKIAHALFYWFEHNDPESIEPIFLRPIVSNLLVMQKAIGQWLDNKAIKSIHLTEAEIKGQLVEGTIVK